MSFFGLFPHSQPRFNKTVVTYTTLTLEPFITDLKLIRICFKLSSNNIYPFPAVYTRLSKRNNDRFQFSRLHLPIVQNATRMSEISRILRFQLFKLQNYQSFKTQNENGNSLRKLLSFSFYPFLL